MKKIETLVLNQIAKKELSQRQLGKVKGGRISCLCGCCYAGDAGGSSTTNNGDANCSAGKYSTCGFALVVVC